MEPTKSSQPNPSSSPFNPFKSKKILQSSTSNTSPSRTSDPNINTPQKQQTNLRPRSKSAIFSLNQVKKVANILNNSKKPAPSSDPLDLLEYTPKKPKKKFVNPIKLPERFEILSKMFDSLVCSIRLLKMKGTLSSFSNISKSIGTLTDRRFGYNHLAQMKYILPEGIVLKKDLICNDETRCMTPYLQISLEIDAIENDGKWKDSIGYSNVGRVFRSRILDFINSHPEVEEIPEETLPEPFNQTVEKVVMCSNHASISSLPSVTACPQQYTATASHVPKTFQKRFVQRVPVSESQKTLLLSATVKPSSQIGSCLESNKSNEATSDSVVPYPLEHSSTSPAITKKVPLSSPTVLLPPTSPLKIGELETVNEPSPKETNFSEATPVKLVCTPARLMTITPDSQTPKKVRATPDEDCSASPSKLVRRPPRNRPLFQTPVKNAKARDEINEVGTTTIDPDILKLLPKTLIQSIKEKEKRTAEGQDIAISDAKRRRQMIASLPKLFNMIHLMSDKRCVITKQELMHRILVNHFDIVDSGEIEQQLKLLLELASDWISAKVSLNGDCLLCVNKMSCPDTIRKRLEEAV